MKHKRRLIKILTKKRKIELLQELEQTNRMINLYHDLKTKAYDCRYWSNSQIEKDTMGMYVDEAHNKEVYYKQRRVEILEELGVCY